MSLVTRCTACGTLFKVVADQLKISDGWVRCGQCATVFDAQANLVQAQTALNDLPVQAPAPVSSSADLAPAPIAPISYTADSTASGADPITDTSGSGGYDLENTQMEVQAVIAARNGASLLPYPQSSDSNNFRAGVLRDPNEVDSDVGVSTTSWATSDDANLQNSNLSSSSVSAEPTTLQPPSSILQGEVSSSSPTPSFIAQAHRAQRWRSPWMRFGLSLSAIVLLSILALQFALHEKDRIAAMRPESKHWLDQLCQYASCQVQPFKRIEAIAVDASSFNRINKNNTQLEAITQSYKLAVTLRNTGALPVALPHVELSLQDAQDQTILRRILSPADLGSTLSALAPTQDMAGNVTLQVDTAQLSGQRIAGYRVLAFYP